MEPWVDYKAEIGHFGFYPSVDFFNVVKLKPHDIEFDAYVKPAMRPEFVDDPDSKSEDFDFWQGPGSYSVHATVGGNLQSAFNPQKYEWQIDGADLTPLPREGDVAVIDNQRPEGSTPYKTFNFDFGDISDTSLDDFPITTTVNVTVSGPGEDATSTSEILTAKAKVHWHLPPGTLFKARFHAITVRQTNDTDDSPDADIWAEAKAVEQVHKDFVHTGAHLVKTALEGEVLIVSFFVPDETDLLLGAGRAVKTKRPLASYGELSNR